MKKYSENSRENTMLSENYAKVYLPTFYDDLDEIMYHITYILKKPTAANRLYYDVIDAIDKRIQYPLSFEPMKTSRNRNKPYYRIYVSNFIIYYTVYEKTVEFRRILYKRKDIGSL